MASSSTLSMLAEPCIAHPLQSPHWHRVSALRPRLVSTLRMRRVWTRGQRWYVLHHPEQGQPCRLNPQAYAIAARLDGRRSVDEIWQLLDQQASQHPPLDAPSQDEVIDLLRRLHEHALLAHEQAPDFGTWGKAVHKTNHPQPADAHKSVWAWRLHLMDPSDWLARHSHWAHGLFSSTGAAVWLALMGLLAALWATHASALQAHAQNWLATPRYVWLSLLCYPAIKALHEGAHALAVQRHGGQIRSCGISLMMLMPVPYVDASDTHGFAHAWQRGVVSAAGIMAELSLASLGLATWAWSDAGLMHDLGFLIWFIGCTSTLLFNGNPLQRMDGYHLMTDLLQLPGLATRSSQWWRSRWLQWAGAQATSHRMDQAQAADGETFWLAAYAPMAWLCQWGLWAGISLWLGSISAPLGWLAGLGVVARLALWPWVQLVRQAWQSHLVHTGPLASAWRPALTLLLPIALLLVPWPDQALVQGVVWAPDQALVRAEVEGQVHQVLRQDGDTVQVGTPLLRLNNPRLLVERAHVAAQLDRALLGEFQHMGLHGAQSGQAADEATQLQAQLRHLDAQIQSLTIKAHQAGTLRWPQPRDLSERYLRRGDLIGHVIDTQAVVIRLALPQDSELPKRHGATQASVHLSGQGEHPHPATLERDSMGATLQLPSAALSDAMGGDIQTDPKDEQHLHTLRPIVWMDVRVPGLRLDGAPGAATQAAAPRLGQRAWVRLDHGMAPLAWQWLQQARRSMDTSFSGR